MRWREALVIPLMILAVVAQFALLPRLGDFDHTPQLLLLLALAWTLLHGLRPGLVWAFVAGMVVDLFSVSPAGVSALAYMTAVAAVAGIKTLLPPNRTLVPLFLAGVGTFVSLLVSFVLIRLLGIELPWGAAAAASPLILLHAVLVLPLYWLIYGLERLLGPRRIELT